MATVKADGETVGGVAEYRRLDECEFVIPEVSFLPELNEQGGVNALRAYSLLWTVPTVADTRGAVLRFHRVVVTMRNEGANSLVVNAMQPHGYEASPGTPAAWTALKAGTLVVGEELTMVVHPVVNNFVVPLRSLASGHDSIVVFTMTVARQYVTQAGNVVPAAALLQEVGLRFSIRAYYDSSGNSLEPGQYFQVRSGGGDHVFAVRSDPPLPKSAGELLGMFPTTARVNAVGFVRDSYDVGNEAYQTYTMAWLDAAGSVVSQVDGGLLSPDTPYRIPGVLAVAGRAVNGPSVVGRYVRWFQRASKWVLCFTPLGNVEQAVCAASANTPVIVVLDLAVNFTPASTAAWAALAKNGRKAATVKRPGRAGVHALQLGAWQDDVVSAVTFVVRVLKVASMIAGAVGLLEVVAVPKNGDLLSQYEL